MEKFMKSLVRGNYITSAILIVLGLLLTIRSDDTIVAISYLIGGSIIIIGVLALIKFVKNLGKSFDNSFEIIYGIITIVFGILIISNPKMVATIIPFVIGGWILIKSSFKIAYAIELKNRGSIYWKSALITSIINALVGILIVFNPFKTSVIVFKIIGIAILVYAILDIVSTIQIKKEFPKTNEEKEDTSIEKITTSEVIVDADIEEIKEADIEDEVKDNISEEVKEESETDKTEEKEIKPKKKKRKTKKKSNDKKDSE
jgi:uncharacterized membrane protein HdeD (DUF308 family)